MPAAPTKEHAPEAKERRGATLHRRAALSVLVLPMLQSCCRVGCAAPPRPCFVNKLGSLAPSGQNGGSWQCTIAQSYYHRQHALLRNAGPASVLPSCRLRVRMLPVLTCNLHTSFPNGLLSPSPGGGYLDPGTTNSAGVAAGVLDANNVHVWMVQTDSIADRGHDFLESLRETLSEDEMERYRSSLTTPKAREQALSFLVARSLLRCTLSRYCPQVAPKCWRFEVNAYGRPSLCSKLQQELSEDRSNEALQAILRSLTKLRFNLSHCAGMVVCAIAYEREVGIDSENVNSKRRITSIARRFFTPSETASLLSVPEHAQPLTFSRLWTLKEAYVKARGLGISGVGLDNFEFKDIASFGLERPTGSLTADLSKAGDAASDWQFVLLDPPGVSADRARKREGAGSENEPWGGGGKRGHKHLGGEMRHTVALAASCGANSGPAEVSVFRTIPLASTADELLDFSQVVVMSSHADAAAWRGGIRRGGVTTSNSGVSSIPPFVCS